MKKSFSYLLLMFLVLTGCNDINSSFETVPLPPNITGEIIYTNKVKTDQYDPQQRNPENQIKIIDTSLHDKTRNRDIPLRIYLPNTKSMAPILIFSHGLGGSCLGNAYLGSHWSQCGYIAVFLQHKGSDDSVWKNKSNTDAFRDMKKAASAENLFLRVKDVSIVIDQLEKWNVEEGHDLHNRMNLKKIGMSGHSFGAITTQFISGQSFRISDIVMDSRIKASVLLSPSCPKWTRESIAFGSVKIPWLIMTGTHDNSMINDSDAASRLKIFPALPKGDKYELVLNKAEHSAFNDRKLPGDKQARNPQHHKSILAISTAFWDAFLLENQEAKNWLNGNTVKELLDKDDRWQKK